MDALSPRFEPAAARLAEILARPGIGGWLLGLLLATVAYAAFFDGGTGVPDESRLQIGIAAIALGAGIGLGAGVLVPARAPLAWAAVGLFGLFAAWSLISIEWSAAPDQSWLAANRAATYAATVAIALVVSASLARAPAYTALGLAAVTVPVALYALGGKLFPDLSLLGITFNHTDEFSRLREPIGYWNALGLFLLMGVPACIWLSTDEGASIRLRIGTIAVLTLLIVTAGLTYSRGAIIAFAVMAAVMVGFGPRRLARTVVVAAALLFAAPALIIGYSRDDLTTDALAVSERSDGGVVLAVALLVSLVLLVLFCRAALRLEPDIRWKPHHSRFAWRLLAGIAVAACLATLIGLATSERGVSGTASHEWREFKRVKGTEINDPNRLVSTSGSNRWVWWSEALGAWSDEPVQGWGAGSFRVVHNLYTEHRLPVRQAHSVPLEFLAETGLVGALLALGALGLLGAAAVTAVRRAQGPDRSARLALLAVAAAWAVHSLYDWDWVMPAVTMPALLAVAVAAAPAAPDRPEERGLSGGAPASLPALAGIVAVAAVTLAVAAFLPAWSENRRLAGAKIAESKGSDPATLRLAAKRANLAHKLNPLSVEPLFAASDIAVRRRRYREAFEFAAEAARLQPDNFQVWVRLLSLQLLTGDRRLADEVIARAFRADPQAANLPKSQIAGLVLLDTSPLLSPTAFGTPLEPPPEPAAPGAAPLTPAPGAAPPGTAPPGAAPPGQ